MNKHLFSFAGFCLLSSILLGCGSTPSSSGSSGTSSSGGSSSAASLSVTGVTPAVIPAQAAATLTVTGTGFTATSMVQVNGTALATALVSATQLTAAITAGQFNSATALAVTVSDKGSTTGGSANVQVGNPVPAVSSLMPASVLVGAGAVTVTVAGTGFTSGTVIQVNGVARSTVYNSGTQVSVTLDPTDVAATGSLSVTAVNSAPAGGTSAASLPVMNPAPSAITLTPASIDGGGTATLPLTVAGSGFVPSSTIQVDGTARTTTFVSATQLRTSLTAADQAAARTLSVAVVTPAPGGGTSQPALLTVHVNPLPVLTSASASSVVAGAATSLHLFGSGFTASSTALWNGSALSTQFVNATELVATVDAARTATAGTATLAVSTPAPGGGTSAPLSVAVLSAVPVLTSISPAAIFRSPASTVLTLQGTGFQPTSTVVWNGSAYATTFISSTQLSIKVLQADVPTTATATVQVSTPAPGGGTSATLTLPVYAFKPSITAVRQTLGGTNCQQINLSISGQYFPTSGLAVKLNGNPVSVSFGSSTFISAYLPGNLGVVANPQLTVEFTYQDGAISDPFPLQPQIATCIAPSTAGTYPGSTLAYDLTVTSLGNGTLPTATSLTLPAGFTAAASTPYAIPSRFAVGVAPSVVAGSYSLGLQIAGESAARTLPVTVRAGTPSFFFSTPSYSDLAVSPGGSTGFSAYGIANSNGDGTTNFLITPTVTGLPAGVTASIQPAKALPNESFTVTLKADSSAPLRQNVPITLTATADGTTATASVAYTLSVAPAPGTIPDNRTAFTPLGATPASLAYDRVHGLVFASNAVWNRIDIVSATTHAIVQSIPLASPTRIDLSQDSGTLWIGTQSQQVYALNTSTFALTRYALPDVAFYSNTGPEHWTVGELYALNNGTLLLVASQQGSPQKIVVWSPATNTLTGYNNVFSLLRSGDGSKVFGLYTDFSGCKLQVYSAAQAAMSTYTVDSGFTGSSYCGTLQASNADGSLLVTNLTGQTLRGIQLINATGQSQGAFTAALVSGSLNTPENVQFNPATFAFSRDGSSLYQTGTLSGRGGLLATYNVASRALVGLAPAISSPMAPLSSGYGGNTVPAAVEDNGVLIGVQNFGIAWEDTTYFQDYGTGTLNISGGSPGRFAPLSGPLSGGTSYSAYSSFATQPDVWFNDIRGVSSLSGSTLTLTTPAGAAPGPVDIKTISPNGELGYVALGFSYGPAPQQAVYSGSSPAGGAPATITGFGLPVDSSSGSISVGGASATITSTVGQYPPWTGEAVPSTYLKFTLPAGRPGYADLQVTTPSGSGTLPRAVFYANNVTDYTFTGTPSAVLYDRFRKQAYVITQTAVLPFANGAFQSALVTPTTRGVVDLRDGALSVDGNYLLVGNAGDGSVAVLNLQTPSASYALPVPDLYSSFNTCTIGPGAVAALPDGKALVLPTPPSSATGSQCGYTTKFAVIDYQAHTTATLSNLPTGCDSQTRAQLQGTADGSLLAIKNGSFGGGCFYRPTTGLTSGGLVSANYGVSISADGTIVGGDTNLFGIQGEPLSTQAQPPVLFATPLTYGYPADSRTVTLRGIHLNAAGALSYQPHAGYFDVIDALTNSLRMRFSLTETVQDVPDPLAIDEAGRQVFLLTDQGLTVVDLGQAPLAFGHLGTAAPSSGGMVQVRGSGFDATLTATVDKLAATVTLTDENTLNLSLPSLGSGAHTLVLTRGDGSVLTLRSVLTIP